MPRIICTMTAGQTRSTPVPDVSIVCPTYCESDNLVDLVVQIHAAVCRSHLTEEIIVIDDDSPDQTSQICSQLAEAYPLQLVVRKNARGLSSAVIHGLNIARGGIFVVMDADLSHPPEKIPALVSAIAHEGAEFAVGSRYTAGGGTDEQWAASRRLLSRLGTWLARPLTSISDPMSGFFAMPRQAFHSVANELNPLGYKIGLEILVKLRCQTIAEVPIQFRPRRRGVSKLSLHEELRFLRHLCRLYGYGLKGSQ